MECKATAVDNDVPLSPDGCLAGVRASGSHGIVFVGEVSAGGAVLQATILPYLPKAGFQRMSQALESRRVL